MDLSPPPTVLSFVSKMISKNREDALREFIVAYNLSDKMFSVMEREVPNSGFPAGKFLNRTKCVNPNTGCPYEPEELFIGTEITLCGWVFKLVEATEGTLKAMEAHSDVFSRSDLFTILNSIISKLEGKKSTVEAAFQRHDKTGRSMVDKKDMRNVLRDFGVELEEQEFLTLFRRYQFADSDRFLYEDFLNVLR